MLWLGWVLASGCVALDQDGDGFVVGHDCDDDDASIHPNQTETCDDGGLDRDCTGDPDDASVVWAQDWDRDGFGRATGHIDGDCRSPELADADQIYQRASWPTLSEDGLSTTRAEIDCDDHDADVFPGQTERCDDQDRDCDGVSGADQDGPHDRWLDQDDDGFGAGAPVTRGACDEPGDGFADIDTDCDDGDDAVFPGAAEVCGDGVRNDCSGRYDLARDVERLWVAQCSACHDVDDPRARSWDVATGATGWVVPGSSDRSPLITALLDQDLHPDVDPQTVAWLQEWIDTGAQEFGGALETCRGLPPSLDGALPLTSRADARLGRQVLAVSDTALLASGNQGLLRFDASDWSTPESIALPLASDDQPYRVISMVLGSGDTAWIGLQDTSVEGIEAVTAVLDLAAAPPSLTLVIDQVWPMAHTDMGVLVTVLQDTSDGTGDHRGVGLLDGSTLKGVWRPFEMQDGTELETPYHECHMLGQSMDAQTDASGRTLVLTGAPGRCADLPDQQTSGPPLRASGGSVFLLELVDGGFVERDRLDADALGLALGTAVALGDLDGDGALDAAVGAPGHSADWVTGQVLVFFDVAANGLQDPVVILGRDPQDMLGIGLAIADFDGDGLDDLLMGAQRHDDRAGAIGLLHGPLVQADLDAADPWIVGTYRNGYLGDILELAAFSGSAGPNTLLLGQSFGASDQGVVWVVPMVQP